MAGRTTDLSPQLNETGSPFHDVLDELVLRTLPPVSAALAVLYLALAAAHLILLPRGVALPMSILAVVTSILLIALSVILKRWPLSPRRANPIGAGVVGLVLLNSLLHLYLTGEPRQTTNLMLLLVGCGFLFLSTPWFVGSLAVILSGWGIGWLLLPPATGWLHFGIGLFLATVLSVLAHVTRVRTFRRIAGLRRQDRRRQVELREALTAARESEAKFRTLFNNAGEAIFIHDLEGHIFEVNDVACDRLGYSREQLLDMTPQDFTIAPESPLLPELTVESAASYEAQLKKKGRIILETAHVTKDGVTIPTELSSRRIEYEGEPAVLTIARDITERKQAEDKLREYQQNLAEMVEESTRELREAQKKLLEQQRLRQELQLAADIQASLLPDQVPSLDGFEFAATALPARHVSGDLYDFVLPNEEICHIVVADIAGKGIPAAMLTSEARALVRAETENEDSPHAILTNVGHSLHQDLERAEMFITLLSARLDVRSGKLSYANAGHTEPLWCRHGQGMARLSSTGLPVGIFLDSEIKERGIGLRPGDLVVFYSDGIPEAANPDGERFGMERFTDLLCQHKDAARTASSVRDTVIEGVESFRSGSPLSDDLTLVVLRALPRQVDFDCPADHEHLDQMTASVREAVQAYGEEVASQVELAASEILTNVVRHAYGDTSGRVWGTVALFPDRVQLDVYDRGRSFDPQTVPEPDLETPLEQGYGLVIVRRVMDEVTYRPDTPDGNHWRLIKYLEGHEA